MSDGAEKSAEAMMVAAEGVLTETRETSEALTVSALQQAQRRRKVSSKLTRT